MLRLLFDQDFNHNIVRGLFLRSPSLDGVAARHAGLAEAPDAELLDWAAHECSSLGGSRSDEVE